MSDRWISVGDLGMVVGLPFLWAVSWLLPERLWRHFCRGVHPLVVSAILDESGTLAEVIEKTLGKRRPDVLASDIQRGLAELEVRAVLEVLRHYRPGHLSQRVGLVGSEQIAAALGHGRGVVLWVGVCADSGNLLSKLAFHRAGFAYTQLTSAGHPYSETRFGRRFLNPIHTAVEDRYLVSQVMLSPGAAGIALQELEARLGDNGIVAYTAHRKAKRPLTAPFLNGAITLGPGAPIMARKTGAPLLPVFTFRNAAGLPTVTVGPPIDLRQDSPEDQATADAVRQYVSLLEPLVLEHPTQWRGWLLL